MSRKVSKIDDANHPGHGFFEVEGHSGHFDEHTAKRVAAQLDAADGAESSPQGAHKAPSAVSASKDGSVTCPSCGHRFKAAAPAKEEAEETDETDATDAESGESNNLQE